MALPVEALTPRALAQQVQAIAADL
jgi:hypothetical protein